MSVIRTLTVAISNELSSVKNHFIEQGHRVVPVLRDGMHDVDAIVLSGMRKNVAGIQDIQIDVPIVEARGLAPEEIMAEVERRTRLM